MVDGVGVEGYNPHFPLSLFQGWTTFPWSTLGLAAGKPVPPADVRQGAVLEDDVPAVELIRIWFGESVEDEGTRTKLWPPKGNSVPVAPTLPSPDIVICGESVADEFKRTSSLPSPELLSTGGI